MIRLNNLYISPYKIMLFFVDTLLLLGAAAIGYYLRFGLQEHSFLVNHLLNRGLFFAFVFQASLYYFKLYELKTIRDRSKFSRCFSGSVTLTLVALMISYYIFPFLYLGRGVLFFTVCFGIALAFLWRILYRVIIKGSQLNERIIILGTGEFAREITREIHEKGDSGFQVIGYIDDQKENKT